MDKGDKQEMQNGKFIDEKYMYKNLHLIFLCGIYAFILNRQRFKNFTNQGWMWEGKVTVDGIPF